MRMTRLDETLVNRTAKGRANIERVTAQLAQFPDLGAGDALELSCGIGDVSAFLAERGFRVVGGDVDAEQVALARMRHREAANLVFALADARHLEFDDDSFNLVVSQNVFHHIPDWRLAVREIARVLRPGRYLLWLDLTTPSALQFLLSPFRNYSGLYSSRELRTAFQAEGLLAHSLQWVVPAFRCELMWQKRPIQDRVL
jgi:ubiquinone/menaquinone biosynthesis C-methylase UbiE